MYILSDKSTVHCNKIFRDHPTSRLWWYIYFLYWVKKYIKYNVYISYFLQTSRFANSIRPVWLLRKHVYCWCLKTCQKDLQVAAWRRYQCPGTRQRLGLVVSKVKTGALLSTCHTTVEYLVVKNIKRDIYYRFMLIFRIPFCYGGAVQYFMHDMSRI